MKKLSDVEKYRRVYDGRRFEDVFPQVKSVTVTYRRLYKTAFGDLSDQQDISSVHKPGTDCTFAVKCRNNECTIGYFNLYSIVAGMVSRGLVTTSGTIPCSGEEADDHHYRCQCELGYRIAVEYRDAK